MWWSDRRGVLTLLGGAGLSPLLAGCGFTPVHGPQGAGQALRDSIRADDPVTRRDFHFVSALEDRLGRPGDGAFRLTYTIDITETERGAARSVGATRNLMRGRLDYILTRADGSAVTEGHVGANTAYSLTSTQLATLAAREDAELRIIRMLVDGLVSRLMIDPALQPPA